MGKRVAGQYLVFVLGLTALWSVADPAVFLVASGSAHLFMSLYLMRAEVRHSSIFITPILVYSGWYALMFGPAAIYHGLRYADLRIVQFSVLSLSLEEVSFGYILTVWGGFSICCGLAAGRPKQEWTGRTGAVVNNRMALGVMWLLGVILQATDGWKVLGALPSVLRYAGTASLCLFSETIPERRTNNFSAFGILVAGCLILFVASASFGSKMEMMYALFPLVWFLSRTAARRRWLWGAIPVLFSFLIFAIAPIVTIARNTAGSASLVDSSQLLQTIQQFQSVAGTSSWQEYVDEWGEEFFKRVFDPLSVGAVEQIVRTQGYSYGANLDYVVWALIPRILWPDKPNVPRGRWFTAQMGVEINENETFGTSFGMTSPGELYWNFGPIGVVVGMFLLGYLLSRGWWSISKEAPSTGILPMLSYISVLFTFLTYQGAEAGSAFLQACLHIAVYRCLMLVFPNNTSSGKGKLFTVPNKEAQSSSPA
jgi:oligosaccharide repeat unit polymerase